MPTYHAQVKDNLPAIPEDFQRYIKSLENVLSQVDQFLRQRAAIKDLRHAMREAEAAGQEAGRLKSRQRQRGHQARQPGENRQPPRECQFCGQSPASRVVYIEESGERYSQYLCATCDESEILTINAKDAPE